MILTNNNKSIKLFIKYDKTVRLINNININNFKFKINEVNHKPLA